MARYSSNDYLSYSQYCHMLLSENRSFAEMVTNRLPVMQDKLTHSQALGGNVYESFRAQLAELLETMALSHSAIAIKKAGLMENVRLIGKPEESVRAIFKDFLDQKGRGHFSISELEDVVGDELPSEDLNLAVSYFTKSSGQSLVEMDQFSGCLLS